MRRVVGGLLAGCLLLSACDMLAPAQPKKPVQTRASVRPSMSPTVVMSAPPSRAPKASPTPMGPTTLLKGKVEVDAHYLLAKNAGTIVANNGNSTIQLNTGSLISDNGLGLISDNGLGLISDNGLGLISDNGLGLVAKTFRIRAAGALAAAAGVPLGTVLPVKGMAVLPISMRTGQLVGKPVFTDVSGNYELAVPESLKGNIRLVAKVPVAKADDPIAKDNRLSYDLVVNNTSKAPVIDEDTALVTKYVRSCFASRLEEAMTTDNVGATTEDLLRSLNLDATLIDFMKGSIQDINNAAVKAGVAAMPPAKVDRVAQRVTDVLLSYLDFDTLMADPEMLHRVGYGKKELAIAGMTDLLRQWRTAATTKMAESPTYFDAQPFIVNAKNAKNFLVRKPSDLGDFLVVEYLLSSEDRFDELVTVFESVGLVRADASRLNTLSLGIMANVSQTLFTNADAKQQMLKAIEESAQP